MLYLDQACGLVLQQVGLPDEELGAVDASEVFRPRLWQLAMLGHHMQFKLSLAVSGSEAAVAAVP